MRYQIIGRDGRSRFVTLNGDEDMTDVLEDGERLFVPHQFMDSAPQDPYAITDEMRANVETAYREMRDRTCSAWKGGVDERAVPMSDATVPDNAERAYNDYRAYLNNAWRGAR